MKESYDKWKTNQIKKYIKTTKWRITSDVESGKTYYYDKISNKSTWNKPLELIDFENKIINENDYNSMNDINNIDNVVNNKIEKISSIDECLSILVMNDSIMEPNIKDTIKLLIDRYHVPNETIQNHLSNSYIGYESFVEILVQYIQLGNLINNTSSNTSNISKEDILFNKKDIIKETNHDTTHIDQSNALISTILSDLIVMYYNKQTEDYLLDHLIPNNQIPDYLLELMKDPIYNPVFIELYKKFPDSKLLKMFYDNI